LARGGRGESGPKGVSMLEACGIIRALAPAAIVIFLGACSSPSSSLPGTTEAQYASVTLTAGAKSETQFSPTRLKVQSASVDAVRPQATGGTAAYATLQVSNTTDPLTLLQFNQQGVQVPSGGSSTITFVAGAEVNLKVRGGNTYKFDVIAYSAEDEELARGSVVSFLSAAQGQRVNVPMRTNVGVIELAFAGIPLDEIRPGQGASFSLRVGVHRLEQQVSAVDYEVTYQVTGGRTLAESKFGIAVEADDSPDDLVVVAEVLNNGIYFQSEKRILKSPASLSVWADLLSPEIVLVEYADFIRAYAETYLFVDAIDDFGVPRIRVFDNYMPIASPVDGSFDFYPGVGIPWFPTTPGNHEMTFVAYDNAGNQSTILTMYIPVAPLQ
jgi:hypothetical protein